MHQLLLDVGFSKVEIYKDYSDDEGLYRHAKSPISLDNWNASVLKEHYISAYVVARRV